MGIRSVMFTGPVVAGGHPSCPGAEAKVGCAFGSWPKARAALIVCCVTYFHCVFPAYCLCCCPLHSGGWNDSFSIFIILCFCFSECHLVVAVVVAVASPPSRVSLCSVVLLLQWGHCLWHPGPSMQCHLGCNSERTVCRCFHISGDVPVLVLILSALHLDL